MKFRTHAFARPRFTTDVKVGFDRKKCATDLRLAVAAAAGRFDHEHVARGHLRFVRESERRARAVGAVDPVAPDRARLAARHGRDDEIVPELDGADLQMGGPAVLIFPAEGGAPATHRDHAT